MKNNEILIFFLGFNSGFLVAYIYFRTNAKGKLTKLSQGMNEFTAGSIQFVGLICYRFIRLTAPYMYTLLLVEVVMKHFHHHSVFEPPTLDHDNCPNYWWRNILYINTLFPVDQMVRMAIFWTISVLNWKVCDFFFNFRPFFKFSTLFWIFSSYFRHSSNFRFFSVFRPLSIFSGFRIIWIFVFFGFSNNFGFSTFFEFSNCCRTLEFSDFFELSNFSGLSKCCELSTFFEYSTFFEFSLFFRCFLQIFFNCCIISRIFSFFLSVASFNADDFLLPCSTKSSACCGAGI